MVKFDFPLVLGLPWIGGLELMGMRGDANGW